MLAEATGAHCRLTVPLATLGAEKLVGAEGTSPAPPPAVKVIWMLLLPAGRLLLSVPPLATSRPCNPVVKVTATELDHPLATVGSCTVPGVASSTAICRLAWLLAPWPYTWML